MKIKVSDMTPTQLDWAVLMLVKGEECEWYISHKGELMEEHGDLSWKYSPTTNWNDGGPIIERENITIIRANSDYIDGTSVPNWFAETDKWIGHNITSSCEGEQFDPCFMVDEAGGYYGTTPLIAAMRAFVASKLGREVDIPEELA